MAVSRRSPLVLSPPQALTNMNSSPCFNPLHSRKRSPGAGFLAVFLALAGLSVAQPQPAAPATAAAGKDEPILMLSPFSVSTTADVGYRAGNSVSATRVDTAIKDLPFSVSAFTAQFVSDIGARDLFDIVQYSPGVTNAGVGFASGSSVYAIRGFSQAPQHNGFVGEGYVDSATIERVEVVKGPASVLYGEVAPGGTVNYITKRPTPKAFTTVSGKMGSYDYLRTGVDYNQPLVGDKLLFRFNGVWQNDIEFYSPGQAQSTVLAPTLTWRITPTISLTLDYQNFSRRETPPFETRLPTSRIVAPLPASGILSTASVLQQNSGEDRGFLGFYPLPADFNISANSDRRFSEMESLNAELTAKLGDHWTARANFNWNKSKIWFKSTGLGQVNITVPASYFPAGTTYPATANATYLAAAARYAADMLGDPRLALLAPQAQLQRRINLQETFGHGKATQTEIAGKYQVGGVQVKPLLGASYLENRDNTRSRQAPTAQFFTPWNMYDRRTWNYDTDYNPAIQPLTQFDRGVRRSKAAYAILNASMWDDRIYMVAGARYTKASGSNDNFFNPVASIAKADHDKLAPQFGAGWKIHRDVLLYASYSSSFQNSIANLQIANVPSGPANPSVSKGYEIGMKTDFLGGRVSSTMSLYTIEQQDRVVAFNTTSATGLILVNRMQGTLDRSRGAELEVTWSPTGSFQIFASGSLNDVRVIKVPSGADYLLGSHPENTAKALANLWARYSFSKGAVKGLWLGVGGNYSGKKAQRVNNPGLFTDSYALLNAALGYDWKWSRRPVSATLNWDNITNEAYVPAAFLRGKPAMVTLELKVTY